MQSKVIRDEGDLLSRLVSDLKRCSMISVTEYRQCRKTLQLASGAFAFTLLQQRENSGIEPRNRVFLRGIHLRKGLCGLDLDVLD